MKIGRDEHARFVKAGVLVFFSAIDDSLVLVASTGAPIYTPDMAAAELQKRAPELVDRLRALVAYAMLTGRGVRQVKK